MPHIRDEAVAAYELLTPDLKKQIGTDAIAVLRTAMESAGANPLVDGTIDAALAQHGIDKRNKKEAEAYRRFLVGHFTFGHDAQLRHQQQHFDQAAGGMS